MVQINFSQYNSISYKADTVVALRAYPVTSIVDGMIAFVGGQSALNDGEGGVYAWDASSVTDDDDLDTIAPTGLAVGRWLRILSNKSAAPFVGRGSGALPRPIDAKLKESVSVKDFGAVGDGVADDAAAINTAIAAALALGVSLYLPAGTYLLGTGLSANVGGDSTQSKFRIYGDGPRSSIFKAKPSLAATSLLNIFATAQPTQAQVFVSGLSFDGVAKANGHTGLRLSDVAVFDVSGVLVERCQRGAHLDGALIGTMRACSLFENGTGLYTRKSALGAFVNAITLDTCWIKYNSTYGLDFDEGSALLVLGGTVEENGSSGNTATGGMKIGAKVSDETGFGIITIEGTHIERNLGYQVEVAAQTAGKVLEFTLRGVSIIQSEANRAMRIAGAGHVLLQNCVAGSPGDTVDITASRFTQIGGTIANRTGTIANKPLILNSTDGGASGEGNIASELHLGGGNGVRLTWAGGGGGYYLRPDTNTGTLALDSTGGAAGQLDCALNISLAAGKTLKVSGQQVVSQRQPAIADHASDATVNAIIAALRAHGLIEP